MATVQYNNNIFSFRGKIGRLSYFIQNFIVNILGFKFIYYPLFVESYRTLLATPETKEIITILYQNSFYAALFDNLASAIVEPAYMSYVKYLFLIPLRLIDIKRIRDIINDDMSWFKTSVYAIVLSIPGVDFFSTIFLAVVPPNRFAKNKLKEEVAKKDKVEAKKEHELSMYKRLFEDGKISRAEYLKAIEYDKKSEIKKSNE